MNFFTQLNELLSDSTSLQLSITKKGEKLIITLKPNISTNEKINSIIKPVTLTATPKDFDDKIIDTIKNHKPVVEEKELEINYLSKALANLEQSEAKKLKDKTEKKKSNSSTPTSKPKTPSLFDAPKQDQPEQEIEEEIED